MDRRHGISERVLTAVPEPALRRFALWLGVGGDAARNAPRPALIAIVLDRLRRMRRR